MKTMYSFIVFMALAIICQGATKPVMSIDFDGNYEARISAGVIKGVPSGKPRFVQGKFGQALESGRNVGFVDFVHPHLLNHPSGTIEMWVKRQGWQPDDPHHHVFFENLDGKGWIVLYKFCAGSKIFSLTGAKRSAPFIIGPYTAGYNHADRFAGNYKSPQKWNDDWAHLVMVWSPEGNTTYLNAYPGKNVPCKPTSYAEEYDFGTKFRIGDAPWTLKARGTSLIDRVRIYDKALTADEVRELYYDGLYGKKVPLKPELLDIQYTGNATQRVINVHICSGGATVQRAEAALALPGKKAAQWLPMQVNGDKGDARLTLPKEAGKYDIVIRLNGSEALIARKPFEVPDFSWMNNSLGMERKVMAPWTPVIVRDGRNVQVWNREYRMGGAGLPAQIKTAGQDILDSPVSLNGTCATGKIAWSKPSVKMLSCDGYSAVFSGSVTATASNGRKAIVNIRTEIEFDGFCLINLKADHPEFFTSLSLDIPMKRQHALYRHCYSTKRLGESGSLPAGRGILLQNAYLPFTWLGDNDCGLFWGCESTQFWPNGEARNAMQILRGGARQQVTMRLNLQTKGQQLPASWNYQFMLQATPIKPMPKNWRSLRFRTWEPNMMNNPSLKMNLGYYNLGPTLTVSMYGYPASDNLAMVHKHIKFAKEQGIRLLPYIGLTGQPSFMPEWPFFKDEWYTGAMDLDPSGTDRSTGYATMNVSKRSYQDFAVWKIARFMKEAGYECQYHDNSFPYASTAPNSGLAYKKNGKIYGAYNILGTREISRRNRAVMEAQIPGYNSMAHLSSRIWVPILSFEDIMVFGENYRGSVNDNYTDMIPLDRFRAEYMGRQWGLIPVMMTELPVEQRKAVKPTRGLFALAQLHDVFIWCGRGNLAVHEQCVEPLERFGYQDAEFIPYFASVPPAVTNQPRVLVSAYKKQDGKVLLFIANLGRKPVKTAVTVNLASLGLSGKLSAIDQASEEVVPMDTNVLNLEVEDEGFRVIRLEKFTEPEVNIWG